LISNDLSGVKEIIKNSKSTSETAAKLGQRKDLPEQLRITFDELIRNAASSAKKSILQLLNSDRVQYIILLQNAARSRRNYLLAGEQMKFHSPSEVEGKVIGGMQMTAYVDLEALRPNRKPLQPQSSGASEKSLIQNAA
jgi:hypothetical protein